MKGVLAVHLCQANNQSPYSFVRAKFEPGELLDPWAVRFLDQEGKEVPFFVWDMVTWKVAREGRPDWGNRYALLNHYSGRSPEALESRRRKIERAKERLPELGAVLAAREEAAGKFPGSVCGALYLLRYAVPPYGKVRLTLQLGVEAAAAPKSWHVEGDRVGDRMQAERGQLSFMNLPDRLAVRWKGQEVCRSAGFEAGEASGAFSHADPSMPFALQVTEGLVTKLRVEGRMKGRKESEQGWQCTYWLFPEGSWVALEGFSLGNTEGYLGGEQTLSRWEAMADFAPAHEPTWESPWWLYRLGDDRFIALHQFCSTPLTIGYGNNPFSASPERSHKAVARGNRLDLVWGYDLTDRAVYRLFQRRLPVPTPGNPGPPWLTREAFLTGKLASPPANMPNEEVQALEEALKYTRWEPKVDWLYRQYAVGMGETPPLAEAAVRNVLGAAAGWIDRPFGEEEIAGLLAQSLLGSARRRSPPRPNQSLYEALPYLLNDPDPEGIRQILKSIDDPKDGAAGFIKTIQNHIAAGGNGVTGRWTENPHGEGWESNPAYHSCGMPSSLRFLEHFDLLRFAKYQPPEYREALLGFADLSVKVMGGEPFDPEKFRASLHLCWPNRTVMLFPLVLHAYRIQTDERYAKAARILFDELMSMVDKNPHGYWAAWKFQPREAVIFDTVYNPTGCQRGITAFWAEGLLDLVGRERAGRFVAAQARYAVLSAQFLDTLEKDNMTGVFAYLHHAHPAFSAQIALYLYDDFPFYRGLAGELVRWMVAEGPGIPDGYFSPLFRWTFLIGPGSGWYERKVEARAGFFRVRVRNQLPWAQCSFWVRSDEAGIQPPGRWVLWFQPQEPTFRLESLLEFTVEGEKLLLDVKKRARLRLYYGVPFPGWLGPEKLILTSRSSGDPNRTEEVTGGVEWSADGAGERFLEWEAKRGNYELKPRS
ncbi:MAG: hypothetical protein HY717_20905 [Planctomycetes bacterium]|nr:hypothetical protein [Planctomycetota bacterium]